MWMLLAAIFGSFLLGVAFAAFILYRFSRLPETPPQPAADMERTHEIEPVAMENLTTTLPQPKKTNAFEEKTRQVNLAEFADLLNLDHEEIVAEPIPENSSDQLALAHEDRKRLERAIEQSGPLNLSNPRVIHVIAPSRYVFSSRNNSASLPN